MSGFNRDSVVINLQKEGADIAAVTANFNSDPVDVGRFVELLAVLNVTAHAGTTPTLDVKFQVSADKITWTDLGDAFTQVTTVDSQTIKKITANFGKYIRAVLTIGGTGGPSYTCTLKLVAKQ